MVISDSAVIVEVVAAIIIRSDGRFLLARRPEGKPYSGYWEFPGGKVEAGESLLHALKRELQEELGMQMLHADPWMTRIFTYTHATVRLHFFRVTDWHGGLWARENQRLSWQSPHDIEVEPVLPANAPIIQALQLPSIYAITQATALGIDAALTRIEDALQRGLRMIQIREKEMSREALRTFSGEVIKRAHAYGAKVLINGDGVFSRETDADGVHFSSSQLMALSCRPEQGLCGASCHNTEELHHAAQLNLDFIVLSPVFPTLSHPGSPALGWQKFAALIRDYSLPV